MVNITMFVREYERILRKREYLLMDMDKLLEDYGTFLGCYVGDTLYLSKQLTDRLLPAIVFLELCKKRIVGTELDKKIIKSNNLNWMSGAGDLKKRVLELLNEELYNILKVNNIDINSGNGGAYWLFCEFMTKGQEQALNNLKEIAERPDDQNTLTTPPKTAFLPYYQRSRGNNTLKQYPPRNAKERK